MKIKRNKLNELDKKLNNNNDTQQESLNDLSNKEKADKIKFPNIYSNSNLLTPSPNLNNNKGKLLNINMKKINKLYVSSKPKDISDKNNNEFNKVNVLSKISKRDFSNRATANKILEALNSSSTTNNKLELTKINYSKDEVSLFYDLTKKSINYLKNMNQNDISAINKIKNKYDNINTDNKSYFNAFSENNSNKNTNLTTQRKTLSNHYLKTETNNNMNNINTSKDISLKLFLSNKDSLNQKMIQNCQADSDIESPIKKDINNKKNGNSKRLENNIKTIKLYNRNDKNEKIIENIGQSYNINYSKIKKKILIDSTDSRNYLQKEEFDCPEELHFYYISTIQRGKKSENRF